jgi:hypothetical protein
MEGYQAGSLQDGKTVPGAWEVVPGAGDVAESLLKNLFFSRCMHHNVLYPLKPDFEVKSLES